MIRAAEQLHLSQPSVTAHIRALELQAGEQLFVRVARRGVVPTPRADALARAIGPHLDALEAADTLLTWQDHRQQLLTIGAPADLLALAVIPAIVPLVRHGLHVRAHGGTTTQLLNELEAGRLDAVVMPGTVADHSELIHQWVFDEEFVFVGAPQFADRLPPAVIQAQGVAALDTVPVVAYGESLPIIGLYCRQVFGVQPTALAALVVDDLRAVTAAVRAGAGVTVLPRYHASDDLRRGQLVQLHHPPRPPRDPVFLVHRRHTPTAVVESVIEALRRRSPGADNGTSLGTETEL